DGACPDDPTSSCTLIRDNTVRNNDNANVPAFGLAGSVPVGTGIEISGGQNDTIEGNRLIDNGSWGILVHDYPDTGPPPPVADCSGGTQAGDACFFQAFGNVVRDNSFTHDGFFGNPGNADIGNESSSVVQGNCFSSNTDSAGTLS